MHQEFSAAQGQPAAGALAAGVLVLGLRTTVSRKEAAAKERRQANRMTWCIIGGGVQGFPRRCNRDVPNVLINFKSYYVLCCVLKVHGGHNFFIYK